MSRTDPPAHSGETAPWLRALSAGLAYRQRTGLSKYFRSHWKHILVTEVIFLAIFLFSLSIRLYNPKHSVIADPTHVPLPKIEKVSCT